MGNDRTPPGAIDGEAMVTSQGPLLISGDLKCWICRKVEPFALAPEEVEMFVNLDDDALERVGRSDLLTLKAADNNWVVQIIINPVSGRPSQFSLCSDCVTNIAKQFMSQEKKKDLS